MKWWIYGTGLLLLPVAYIGLMRLTDQPVEWTVIALMALIVLPIVLFGRKISSMEQHFNSLSSKDQAKLVAKSAARVAGQASGSD